MSETIFDKMLSGEIKADVVYEDEDVFAFNDIHPQAPTHVLVIPRKKVARFEEYSSHSSDDVGKFFVGVAKVAEKLNLEKGFRVIMNNGDHGGQSVDYLHAHILGGRPLNWPPG